MFFRIIKSFTFIIISIAILGGGFFAGIYSRDYYKIWQDSRALRNLAELYEQAREGEEARKMADTFGGKTPQETLQMFIDAVEKGDYELASKYFIISRQEKELSSLNSSKPEDINNIISLLKMAINRKNPGDNDIKFQMEVRNSSLKYPLVIDFSKYPNGIWKLTEI